MSSSQKDVEMLSILADQYQDIGKDNPRKDWADLLKAHTLYNACASRSSAKKWREKAFKVQTTYWGDDVSSTLKEQTEITRDFQAQLYTIRDECRNDLSPVADLIKRWDCTTDNLDSTYNQGVTRQLSKGMERVSLSANVKMKVFAGQVIQKSVEVCQKKVPCKFVAVALGSMAKGEATPYSDLEFMFLLEKKTPEIVEYFETLAMTVYFLIGNLRETKLKYMNIAELKAFKDKGKNGFKIDGLQAKAGNIPTGNGTEEQKNKFILTVDELLEKYQNILMNPDPVESKKGDFTSMLAHTTVIYGEPDLLTEFERRKRLVGVNMARKNAHNSMVKQDVEDYNFLPLGELDLTNRSANLKSALYRFPSLLIYNMKIINDIESKTSWETLDNLRQMEKLSQSFYFSLQFLLASALYIRMAAYLHHDSQNDDMIFVPSSKPTSKCHFWHLPKSLHVHMSLHMIPVKRTIAQTSSPLNAVTTEISFDIRAVSAEIHFYADNYVDAIKDLQDIPFHGYDQLTMLSHCYLCLKKWNKYQQSVQNIFDYIKSRAPNPLLSLMLPYWKYKSAAGYSDSGDLASAKKGFEEVLSDLPPHLCYNHEIFAHASNFYLRICDEDKAEHFYKKACCHLEEVASTMNRAYYDTIRSEMLYNRAAALIDTGHYSEAKLILIEDIQSVEQRFGKNGLCIQLANRYTALGNVYCGLRLYPESHEYHQKAEELSKSIESADISESNRSDQDISFALTYEGQGNYAKALERYAQALVQIEKHYPASHPKVADMKRRIGLTLTYLSEYVEAEKLLKESLAIYESLPDNPLYNPELVNCHRDLGYLYFKEQRRSDSLRHLRNAVKFECNRDDIDNMDAVCLALSFIGQNLMAEKRYEEAAASFANFVELRHKQSNIPDVRHAANYRFLGQCYRLCSQHKETSEGSVICSKAHRAFVDAIAVLNNAPTSITENIVAYLLIAVEMFVNWGIWLLAHRNR